MYKQSRNGVTTQKEINEGVLDNYLDYQVALTQGNGIKICHVIIRKKDVYGTPVVI